MGDVIVSLQRAQGMPYKNLGGLAGNKEIKELILDVKLVKDEEVSYGFQLCGHWREANPVAGTL